MQVPPFYQTFSLSIVAINQLEALILRPAAVASGARPRPMTNSDPIHNKCPAYD